MAGKQLKRNVMVGGVLYAAGSTPDKEIADQISNPNAFEEPDNRTPAQKVADEKAKAAAKAAGDK